MMTPIILLSLAGVVISVVVGTLWYMPGTPMGKVHMQYLGFDKLSLEEQQQKIAEAKPTMPKIYGMQMLLSFLMSFAVVFIVTMSMQNGMTFAMALGFVFFNWLCFVVPVVGGNILWGNCDGALARKKFISDALNFLVVIILVAVLTSFFA